MSDFDTAAPDASSPANDPASVEVEKPAMSEEELAAAVGKALALKEEGNQLYKDGEIEEALEKYTEALDCLPEKHANRAVLHANCAAVHMKQEKYEAVIVDCTSCIAVDSKYTKAFLRRCEAYEKTEKYAEAIADIDVVLSLEQQQQHVQRKERLVKMKQVADEKLKEEMMGKLKEFGNTILGKFGLSTENFKMQQDPNTGSYSINFQQNNNSAQKE